MKVCLFDETLCEMQIDKGVVINTSIYGGSLLLGVWTKVNVVAIEMKPV